MHIRYTLYKGESISIKKYSPSYWTYPKIFCITNYFYIDNVVFAIFLKPYITITNCKTLPIPHCFQLSLLPIICLSIPTLIYHHIKMLICTQKFFAIIFIVSNFALHTKNAHAHTQTFQTCPLSSLLLFDLTLMKPVINGFICFAQAINSCNDEGNCQRLKWKKVFRL